MLWLQSGTSLCHAATGDLSDTVRWQNTALCSWNSSMARSMQEAASRGCNILPASVAFEPGRHHPWGEGSRCAPISHPSEPRQDVSWWFALQGRYFHEPPAVGAPGASADGGQHTAKGCQAQAAPRGGQGFHSGLYRHEEAPQRWEGVNRHPAWLALSLHLPERRAPPSAAPTALLPTCLLNKHRAGTAKWFRLYFFISNQPRGVD